MQFSTEFYYIFRFLRDHLDILERFQEDIVRNLLIIELDENTKLNFFHFTPHAKKMQI